MKFYAIKCNDKYLKLKEYGEFIECSLSEIDIYNVSDICKHSTLICDDILRYIGEALDNDNEYGLYDTTLITKSDYRNMKIVKLDVNFSYREI